MPVLFTATVLQPAREARLSTTDTASAYWPDMRVGTRRDPVWACLKLSEVPWIHALMERFRSSRVPVVQATFGVCCVAERLE